MTAQPNPRPLFSGTGETNGLGHEGAPTRPLFWSVRRELWENRSIYIAPLSVAAFVLIGYAMSVSKLPHRRRNLLLIADPDKQRALMEQPYDIVAMMLMLTAFIVAVFYCLDAVHGERRDRSILFWKSLPVSDLTSLLAKAVVALLILPAVTFVIIFFVQLLMLLMSSAVLSMSGMSATAPSPLPFFPMTVVLFYGLVTTVLWQAPIYGWLLLVSAWARRATFLWAILPWSAICVIEKIAFNTRHFADFLGSRLGGGDAAFSIPRQSHDALIPAIDRIAQLAPMQFLTSAGLWLGLLVGVAFFAAAVRLRRYRGPL
jgi:ABC-2 type transport system permease protein